MTLARNGGEPLWLRLPASGEGLRAAEGQEVVLGLRPEMLTDRNGQTSWSSPRSRWSHPRASDIFAVTRLAGKEVVARMRADAKIAAGQTIPFAVNMAKAMLFGPKTTRRLG